MFNVSLPSHPLRVMQILMDHGGIADTNCYLIADESVKQAVLFDAPDHTIEPLLDEAARRGWDVIGLWLTHGHFDHLADHKTLTDRFPNARILMHAADEPKLRDPRSRFFPLPFTIPPGAPDGRVADNDELTLGSLRVRVLHTPGHSPGHVCYHFPDQGLLVGGDLIIGGVVGRTDLPDSSESDLVQSIKRVMNLPLTTQLLPGHGQPSTLAEEKRSNPYVQGALRIG